MQILVLLLFLGLFVYKSLVDKGWQPAIDGWPVAVLFIAPKVLIAGTYWLLLVAVQRALKGPDARRALRWCDWASTVYRTCILGLFMLDLLVGVPTLVQKVVGDLFIVDELIVLAPPLTMLIVGWWAYYPIDRHLRESRLMREVDMGVPVRPIWTRTQFLIAQIRHQLLLMLVPMFMLLAWHEIVWTYWGEHPSALLRGADARPVLSLLGAGFVFLVTPIIMRRIWDTAPLPAGELRSRLVSMCEHYHIGVRELLLWRTFGGMINGAVMGFFGPVRYILLTDALLEALPVRQVEAVMAHELAHIRRHHMFWLLVVASTSMVALTMVFQFGLTSVLATLPATSTTANASIVGTLRSSPAATEIVAYVPAMACWFLVFGWVSRRFERQADTFAVQHIARERAAEDMVITSEPAPVAAVATAAARTVRIDDQAAGAMIRALQIVADLNHIPTDRTTRLLAMLQWRHGTIPWRQNYLRQLVGRNVDDLSIDRQVVWIKIVAGTAALSIIALIASGTVEIAL